ncbi:ATP-grasp domain-containing protein [Piscinibacter sp.]|uniref:ATP-grasp domain-containing protein n=1 Tax=Piscinibacter sp. TaxID=1903157 RepID=UPI00258A0DC7|nr:ATP-grasp domain-containing protein [Piscinibacter sp.]
MSRKGVAGGGRAGAMRRVFVYEYLSGGGRLDDDPQAAAELMPMGVAMRDAMVLDMLCAPDCAVTVATCAEAGTNPPGAACTSARPGETPADFVGRQARQHDAVWLVAPETGGLLGRLAAVVEPARWLGCTPAAIAVASSKRATVEQLHARGVATPLGWRDDPAVRRWVVKPDDGTGAIDSRVHLERSAAERDLAARPAGSGWLEPWVEGEALSVSMLCHDGGADLLSVNRQHIAVDTEGALHFRGVDVNVVPGDDARRPALAALALQVAQALPGLRGFVGIDVVWHAQRGPVLIEVNPRVTSAYVGLSASLGRNIAAELLDGCAGEAGHG